MRHIGSLLLHEAKKAIPPTLFFLVVFHLTSIIRHLDESGLGITPAQSGSATVAALILGKIYLLMDDRSFANRFRSRPLIIGALWKTLIYWTLATLATALEELIPALFSHPHLQEAVADITRNITFSRFLANHLILLAAIFIFSVLSELIRVIGARKVWELFFGRQFLRE